MKKKAIYLIALFIVLVFVGCEDNPVSTKYYPPDTSPKSKIDTSGFRYNGLNREYTVFLPKNYQENMPVVINLHGSNISMSGWMKLTRMNNVADTAGFIVVYPLAVDFGSNSRNWRKSEEVGFISALIDTLETKYNIDMSKVYCTGGSAGGFLTYRLLGELGHRFAAVAPVIGQFFSNATNWKPTQFTPLLIINGTMDQIVPYFRDATGSGWSVEKTINYLVQYNNCSLQADTLLLPDNDTTDNSTIEKISWTNCSDNISIIHYKVIGGGHTWPGGNNDGIPNIYGNLNNDINGSAEIWNFFKNYSNPLVK